MIGVTMKHLRYFEALARLGHFGRAAEDCAISQPALSMQVRELEGLVGAPLVERSPRGIRLTALGEDFAARARDILRAVDGLGDLARAAKGPLGGRLRLGVIPTIAPYLLPRIITRLGQAFPGLSLQPRETVTSRLIDDLLEARLDMAVVALPVSEPGLHEEPLFQEEFLLVRHRDQADQPVPCAEGLREMRLLLLEEGHCFRDQALSFCNISGPATHEQMEGSSLATLVQMVGAGIGVTLIPEMAVALETRNAPVAVSRLTGEHPSRRIGLVWRHSSPLAGQYAEIAALLRSALVQSATGVS
ncbi:MAG: LysR substrate-binding domain-containing protein [Paracoccus sp. (in: a-proteobacteria)]|uniref:hydrogen peroxide-inducible genes activator n=1 Tax=Paracoccus sp. TaxID=267 RepID=UPI0026DFFF80|nr:hydrogen peroxide-inducible genes activator [Paracoccus sp. (in: a-proteobacteria)]MDO5622019.1 LysR substrate-binding domain-containing protein [Paracoccus sp. (in: a-proteobacteria)]